MESNFDFLNKDKTYSEFAEMCREAEKSMLISYATTTIMARRALEIAVKWVYKNDAELSIPYQDNLSSLIHHYTFKNIIEPKLFPMLKYVVSKGNHSVHSTKKVSRQEAILCLRNLFEFACWIDYAYSESQSKVTFKESLLPTGREEQRTKQQLQDLAEKLSTKDQKLEDLIKENDKLRQQNAAKRQENEEARDYQVDELSEFKTRKLYIDLVIEQAGWTIGSNCLEEVKVLGMPNNTGEGFVDYVLYGDNGKPLAVIEAKRTSVDPKIGKQQAKIYADCLEKEHGVRPLIFYTNGFEYYIWDDLSYPERAIAGIYAKKDLDWLIYKRENKKSLDNIYIKDEISGRYYQKAAIRAICDSLKQNFRKSLLVMATGSGKTRTAISLVDVLMNKGWVKNTLFLADRRELVKQAKKNFKKLMPNLTLCNLLDSKDNPESRMVFSTYPTMMNAIDNTRDRREKNLFTPGHFDLIIVDESHRSIYKKYQDIFTYFDGILVGLTATPKDEIDKNTYSVFDLENGVPTYAYDLEEAIKDKYLNGYHTIVTDLKFMEEGIVYDDLSDAEKEEFEDTFEEGVTEISSSKLNKFLFNQGTVDIVIQDLMNNGLRVAGKEKLGKTIIFAANTRHAKFIMERFNKLYPKYKDAFAKEIYNGIKYVDSIIEDFGTKEKLPQIAISVDMLDTGIDIPEILNLVFFKKVRSKAKFWQMIGRGTRLCEDLFGPGIHKGEFRIFDYCSNFEYFRENPNGKEARNVKTLTENIFNCKVEIVQQLQKLDHQDEDQLNHRAKLADELYKQISDIDETKFNVKMRLKSLHKFKRKEEWQNITDEKRSDLEENIALLLEDPFQEEGAKRLDFVMYSLELAFLKGQPITRPKGKVVTTAEKLSEKGNIPQVKAQAKLIADVQQDTFWQEADIFAFEKVREAFRELIKFLDTTDHKIYYTNFDDEVLNKEVKPGEYKVNSLESYRKKVNNYLREHQNDLVIHNLRHNKELSVKMVKHLEKILWEELGTKEDYQKEFGDEPLLKLVLKTLGMDQNAANELFSEFLSDESLNTEQINFVKLILNYVSTNGFIEKRELNEYPFNAHGNVVDLFEGQFETAKKIIDVIDGLNERVNVG